MWKAFAWCVGGIIGVLLAILRFLLPLAVIGVIIFVGNYGIDALPWQDIIRAGKWAIGIIVALLLSWAMFMAIVYMVDWIERGIREFIKSCVVEALNEVRDKEAE